MNLLNKPLKEIKIAVIGAGVTGSYFAHLAASAGCKVAVIEKAKGTGGRTSTRRLSEFGTFNLGTCDFTLDDTWKSRLTNQRSALERLSQDSTYRAKPFANSLPKHLLKGSFLITQHRVTKLSRTADGIKITPETDQLGCFDIVIFTQPPPQGDPLWRDISSLPIPEGSYHPQWVVLFSILKSSLMHSCFTPSGPIESILTNSSTGQEHSNYSIHLCKTWSETNADQPKDFVINTVANILIPQMRSASSKSSHTPFLFKDAHFWKFAHPSIPPGPRPSHLWDIENSVGYASDFFTDGSVQGALTSALNLWQDISIALSPRST